MWESDRQNFGEDAAHASRNIVDNNSLGRSGSVRIGIGCALLMSDCNRDAVREDVDDESFAEMIDL